MLLLCRIIPCVNILHRRSSQWRVLKVMPVHFAGKRVWVGSVNSIKAKSWSLCVIDPKFEWYVYSEPCYKENRKFFNFLKSTMHYTEKRLLWKHHLNFQEFNWFFNYTFYLSFRFLSLFFISKVVFPHFPEFILSITNWGKT